MRWQDVFGFAGLGLVVLGTVLMFPSSTTGIRWTYLLGGSLVWLAGFAMMTGWVAWRWSISKLAREERNACPPAEPRFNERRQKDRRSQGERPLAA